jgi:hypothetical protein
MRKEVVFSPRETHVLRVLAQGDASCTEIDGGKTPYIVTGIIGQIKKKLGRDAIENLSPRRKGAVYSLKGNPSITGFRFADEKKREAKPPKSPLPAPRSKVRLDNPISFFYRSFDDFFHSLPPSEKAAITALRENPHAFTPDDKTGRVLYTMKILGIHPPGKTITSKDKATFALI